MFPALPTLAPSGSFRHAGAPRFAMAPDQWGIDLATTAQATALTYGYIGGTALDGNGVRVQIASGTVALTNAATNYVERTYLGVVSANTAGFTATSIPMAKVVTAAGAITAFSDWRGTAAQSFTLPDAGAVMRAAADKMGDVVSVKDFGAKGDGATNDTLAFQAVATKINAAGGGTVLIPPGVYIVGLQTFAGATGKGYAYQAADILHFKNCTKAIHVIAGGATLKAAAGMKFGSFDPVTGAAHFPGSLPFTNQDYRADVYEGMIRFDACTGGQSVQGGELDGNMANLVLGGQFGDTGYQCWGTGLHANECRGGVSWTNVYTHHHAQDGCYIAFDGMVQTDPASPHTLTNIRSEYNARQGLSWVGGRGVTAINCDFNHTGRGTFLSAPTAGVDIEASDAVTRDGNFTNCRFVDNIGVGVVADNGDNKDMQFDNCTFWGTNAYACWPRGLGFVFNNCRFYGSTLTSQSAHAASPNIYRHCHFEDKAYPVTGVFLATYLIDGTSSPWNVVFEDCEIIANGLRSMYLSQTAGTPTTRSSLIHCQITHKYSGDADTSVAAALHDVFLDDVHFMESITPAPATGYYIDQSNNVLVGYRGVTLDGPSVKWGSPSSGPTGVISGSFAGLTASATKLATARAINGVNFDGTAAITVTAAAGTLTGTTLAATVVTSLLTTVGTLISLTTGAVTVSSGSVRISAGTLGITATPTTWESITITGTLTGNNNQYGVHAQPTFDSTGTATGAVLYAKVSTAAAAFTMTSGMGMQIDSPTIGAGSVITTLYGLFIASQTGGGTTYAIYTNTGAVRLGDTLTVVGGFGCNAKAAQTAFASGGAAPAGGTGAAAGAWDTSAHRDAAITLLNNIRSALVANGIMS